jgi:protein-tyrosine phosphatase
MDEIRPWLFIGRYRDTLNRSYLEQNSIGAMLQMAEFVEQPGIETLYLHVEDMSPISVEMIQQGIRFIQEQLKLNRKILISCGAGINRSTVFCVIALKEIEGLGLLDAYKQVKDKHPESLPHEPAWESLCEYYNETVPFLEILRYKAY